MIVAGIDGSKASVRAVVWAAEEAAWRDTPLRLIHVVDPHKDTDREYAKGYHFLHRAWDAVAGTELPVKLETEVLTGEPAEALAEASRHAEMVCVGSKGQHESGGRRRGSTAADLARIAFSPVAIVRRRHGHGPTTAARRIIALLDESPGSHAVLETAMGEALLRKMSVLAMTPWSAAQHDLEGAACGTVRAQLRDLLDDIEEENTDVRMCATLLPEDLLDVLAQDADTEQLVVVSKSRPDLLEELISSRAWSLLRKTNCSLLVLHGREDDESGLEL